MSNAQPPVKGGVVAYLAVRDAAAAAEFYKTALGAEEVARMAADDGRRLLHVHLYINNGSVMLSDFFPEHGHPEVAPAAFTLTLEVDDADRWWARATQAGEVEVIMPPADMFWGARYGAFKDPFGVAWAFNQPKK